MNDLPGKDLDSAERSTGSPSWRLPAEWHPHRATWVAWPHNRDTWPENLPAAIDEFVGLIQVISRSETVCVVAHGESLDEARRRLENQSRIEFFDIETNDAWIRDYGPTFVIDTEADRLGAVCWKYNGWGEKYPPFDSDQKVARHLVAQLADTSLIDLDLVVEGGAIESDGQGNLLTTESCLLNRNRIGEFEEVSEHRDDLGEAFRRHLGAQQTIWLSGAELAGDDTDGHIDQQLRFIDPQTLVIASCPNPDDPQAASLAHLTREVRERIRAKDLHHELVEIPLPPATVVAGQRIPASYLNFYFCNEGLLVPQFGQLDSDQRALSILRERLPDRKLIGLPSSHLAYGLGSFHCLTQQEPDPGGMIRRDDPN